MPTAGAAVAAAGQPVDDLVDRAIAARDSDHAIAAARTLGQPPRIACRRCFDDVDGSSFGAHAAHDGIDQPVPASASGRIDDQQHRFGGNDVIELSHSIHSRAIGRIHNPLRQAQSCTTDFVSVEFYPHDRDRAQPTCPPSRHLPVRHPSRHAWLPGRTAARFPEEERERHLYLVGDIVDGWRLKRWWYWPQAHNDVVQKIMRKARKGTNVIYIPGNHDEAARHTASSPSAT